MSSDLWFFAFVAFVACVTPGAGVLYTVTSSFRLGKSGAWAAPLGNCTGIIAMSIVSATGLGAVSQATPALFYGLQAVGALMLVWFGWKNWKAKPINLTAAGNNPAVEDKVRSHNLRSAYVGAMLLQPTNPMLIVFLLSLLPLTGGSHVNLMKAESPGPQVDKLVPKVQSTAKILYGIYFALTVLEVVILLLGGMPLFESMLTAFGTAGTGGFGFKNDSFTSFSPYIQWVVTIFMILFGVNFNAYFLLLLRKFNRAISEEVRGYFAIILVAIGIITANIYSLYNSFGEAVRQAAFQVGSIITTTGFSSCDFDLWPTLSKEILVVLMFIGACAGSTGGGIKVSRLLILGKTLRKELKQALHPQVVAPVRMDGKLLNHETIRTTNVFMGAYFFIFVVSFLLISLDGFDMVTNFTAIAATLNNIGPGLAQVGPMMNFGSFTNPAKLVMIFDMLAGRLEIFPMLVLFLPDTWRRF